MTEACPGSPPVRWAAPEAELVLRSDAPRAEWLAARRSGVGSSDASAVLGLSPYTSPYEVWAEKRGLLPPIDHDNDAMMWGRLLEPVIGRWWAKETGIPVRRAGIMRSRRRPWQLASVDYLTGCGGVLEIKTLSWRVADDWTDGQVPDHAEAQTAHQLAVTGRTHAHVVGLVDGRRPLLRTLPRDDELIELIVDQEAPFWQLVVDGVEPGIDGSVATAQALKDRWPALETRRVVLGDRLLELARAKRARAAERDAAEAALLLAENELRAALGDATEAFVDEPDSEEKPKPLVTWRRNGQFSEKRFRALHPDLAADLTVEAAAPVLDVARLKREHPDVYTACRSRVLRVSAPPEEGTA